jgi:hypothetical protein
VTVVPLPPVTLIVGVATAVEPEVPEVAETGTTTGAGAAGSGGGGWVLTTIGALEMAWARPPMTPAAAPAPVLLAGAGASE